MTAEVFRGWLKSSLAEYPGKVSTVLFTGGCNLRCPFCHNAELVLRPETLPSYAPAEVLSWIARRRRLVSAVLVSGGEPTLHPWIDAFFARAREAGVATGLATNGTLPERLESLLAAGLLDYVAMDVKTVLEPSEYAEATGSADGTLADRVRSSLALLMRSGVSYELRCTVVPSLHSLETLVELARELRGARRLVFQEFVPSTAMDPSFRLLAPMGRRELEQARERAAPYVSECLLRSSDTPPLSGPPGQSAASVDQYYAQKLEKVVQ